MKTIDVHAHAIVPASLAEMAASHPEYGPSLSDEDGRSYLSYPGRERLGPLPHAIFDVGERLARMNRQGVDLQVIAIPPPNFHYHLPAPVGVAFATIQNDHLLAMGDAEPGRLHCFATLPLQDIPASLAEIGRVAAHPRVRGVQIGGNVGGVELDDPSLDPVWTALAQANLPVWVHPDQRSIAGPERLDSYYLQNLIGIPLESTIAAARIIFGGVLASHPDLRFGFVHGGGFSPYQIGRWDHGWRVRSESRKRIAGEMPRRYFDMLYFDSLTHDRLALDFLGRRVGWDHVLLGSDFPFDMAMDDPVQSIAELGLGERDQEAVTGGNALRFLRPVEADDR